MEHAEDHVDSTGFHLELTARRCELCCLVARLDFDNHEYGDEGDIAREGVFKLFEAGACASILAAFISFIACHFEPNQDHDSKDEVKHPHAAISLRLELVSVLLVAASRARISCIESQQSLVGDLCICLVLRDV